MSQSPAALCSLLDVFAAIPSSRHARGTRYPQHAVFALIFIALLSGCKNYSQISVFAHTRNALLEKLGFRPPHYPRKTESKNRISAPCEDTLTRVVASVSPRVFNEHLAQFLGRMVQRGAQAAIDGKALRGAEEYVLSIFANEICQVVWQEDVGRDKENECSCLARSLEKIFAHYPQLRLFTGDAAFCHKAIARALIAAKRDYWLQLKAPHTTDLMLADDAFAQLRHTPPLATEVEKRGPHAGRKS
jgi:hypothetical protein